MNHPLSDTHWIVYASGYIDFASGERVSGAWDYGCQFGYAAGWLKNSLLQKAKEQKIKGRRRPVKFICHVLVYNPPKPKKD